VQRRARRIDIVHNHNALRRLAPNFEGSSEIQRSLRSAQSGLAGGVLPASKQPAVYLELECLREQFGLIEASLAFPRAMQRDRHDDRSGKTLGTHMLAKPLAQRPSQRNAA
jgi:hypothetical protein